jgi:hypothetical protein
MQVGLLLQRVQDILQDTTKVRWPEAELMRYLDDAQREVVLHKPDASSTTAVMPCVAGTKQTLPVGGLRLLEVIRNMGSTGTTPGNAITLVGRGVLDAQRRGWHGEAPTASVDHYVFDPRDPKTFYVYPPAASTARIEIMYSVTPASITTAAQSIGLDAIYSNALIDYVLYRAYSKDADFAANLDRALTHYEAFASSLGIKTISGLMFSPRANQRDTRDSTHQPPVMG